MNAVNFKKTTLTFMASRIPEDQIKELRNAFVKIDKDGNGVLTKEELMEGVFNIPNCGIREEDWDQIFKLMDSDGSG